MFYVSIPEKDTNTPTRIVINNSIHDDVLNHPSKSITSEDVITIYCSPQAVFRVRPATRCSSTLTGTLICSYSWGYFQSDDTNLGHSSPILCASFSPTGTLLATGSGDNNARLWDINTETPSHVLTGHKGWVLCVEWEARERKLATGGHDGHVRFFNHQVGFRLGLLVGGIGPSLGPQSRQTRWRRYEGSFQVDYVSLMGANSFVSRFASFSLHSF